MTPGQRSSYFLLWADACAAQGWSAKDNAKRQQATVDCMRAVRGPATSSTSDLGQDEITALFCYLTYLKTGEADLDAAARWVDCQQDYKAYSRARHADWHEQKLYGKTGKPNKLDRNRFAGAKSATGEPLDKFDPKAIHQRHLTMASRHQKKARTQGQAGPATPQKTPPRAPGSQIPPAPRATPVPVWDGQF
jgi:hypothetical protein